MTDAEARREPDKAAHPLPRAAVPLIVLQLIISLIGSTFLALACSAENTTDLPAACGGLDHVPGILQITVPALLLAALSAVKPLRRRLVALEVIVLAGTTVFYVLPFTLSW